MALIEQVRAFHDALAEHLNAIANRDIERFAQTLHPDVRLVGPKGAIITGRDAAVAAHRTWFSEGGWLFEPAICWSEERGESAWTLASVRYCAGESVSHFLLFMLFIRESGSWKLMYDQNTPFEGPTLRDTGATL